MRHASTKCYRTQTNNMVRCMRRHTCRNQGLNDKVETNGQTRPILFNSITFSLFYFYYFTTFIISSLTGSALISMFCVWYMRLQCFDAVGWAAGRASGL